MLRRPWFSSPLGGSANPGGDFHRRTGQTVGRVVVLALPLPDLFARTVHCGFDIGGRIPFFLFELHGNIRLYYQRFFGSSRMRAARALRRTQVSPLPTELIRPRQGILLLLVALTLYALFRLRRERAQLFAWLLLLPLGWLAYSYGFYVDQGGGRLQYFCASSSPSGSLSCTLCPRGTSGDRWRI